jgi:hypothetical protein
VPIHRAALVVTAAVWALVACHPNYPSKSTIAKLTELKREVKRLQEENRLLTLKLEEAHKRYGIRLDRLHPEKARHSSIFDRVFSDAKAGSGQPAAR